MRLQVLLVVLILGGIGAWMVGRPGPEPPPDLARERDEFVRAADVLVAEFSSGVETPVRYMTRVGKDSWILEDRNDNRGRSLVQTEAGQFYELVPGCWVEWAQPQVLPMVPGLSVSQSLKSAPRLRNQGNGRYSYFYQFDPPRFFDVTEDLHTIGQGMFLATTRSGAPGGANGIFTIRAADPAWEAEARSIVAGIAGAEISHVRVALRTGSQTERSAVIARDCPALFAGFSGAEIEIDDGGQAWLNNVVVVDLPPGAPLTAIRELAEGRPAGPARLRAGTTYVASWSRTTIFEIQACEATQWFRCD